MRFQCRLIDPERAFSLAAHPLIGLTYINENGATGGARPCLMRCDFSDAHRDIIE